MPVASYPPMPPAPLTPEELFAPLNYHPLSNDRTTAVAPADLLRFIAACGHVPRVVDLAPFERAPAATAR